MIYIEIINLRTAKSAGYLGNAGLYESVDAMQVAPETYRVAYDTKRPRLDRYMNGRTAMAAFLVSLPASYTAAPKR